MIRVNYVTHTTLTLINAVCCLSGGGVEAAYDTAVDKAGGSQKPTSQATIVRDLAKLNHVATDTVSTCRVKFTCSTAPSLFSYKCEKCGKNYSATYYKKL